jgi:hypothetical protein
VQWYQLDSTAHLIFPTEVPRSIQEVDNGAIMGFGADLVACAHITACVHMLQRVCVCVCVCVCVLCVCVRASVYVKVCTQVCVRLCVYEYLSILCI